MPFASVDFGHGASDDGLGRGNVIGRTTNRVEDLEGELVSLECPAEVDPVTAIVHPDPVTTILVGRLAHFVVAVWMIDDVRPIGAIEHERPVARVAAGIGISHTTVEKLLPRNREPVRTV